MAAAVLTAAVLLSGGPDGQALAQSQGGGSGGLFEFLFQRDQPPPRRLREAPPRKREQGQRVQGRKKQQEPRREASARSSARKKRSVVVEAAPEPVPVKATDARKVLVVGDFVAGGLQEGLEAAFAKEPGIRFLDKSNGSSGLVRDDYYNWPQELASLLQTEQPAAVVVMLGANDRQQLRVGGETIEPRKPEWFVEYEKRVSAIAGLVREKNIPLIWVGMIPFKSNSMSSDMIALNDVYRRVSESAGGEFIDVWEGFVDENGAFVTNGPDINGQPVRLRASDGINISKAGRRKIAFYLEKPLRKLLGQPAGANVAALTPGNAGLASPDQGTALPGRVDRTQPIALGDAEPDPAQDLMGDAARNEGVSAVQAAGQPAQPAPGRVDDFSAPLRQPSNLPAPDPEITTAIPLAPG
jgi:uncharacterized protein